MKRKVIAGGFGAITVLVLVLLLFFSSSNSSIEKISGIKILKGTWTWDIDSNTDGKKESADLWWEHVNEHERYLVPRNGALLGVVEGKKFKKINFNDIENAPLTPAGISASDAKPDIDSGTVLAVRTNEGNLAKLEVISFAPLKSSRHEIDKYDMKLRYVLYINKSSALPPR